MDREKLIEIAYQRGNQLNLNNLEYFNWVKKFIENQYREDIKFGDITSDAILGKDDNFIHAIIKTKKPGIVAGLEEVSWFYKSHGLIPTFYKKDGDKIEEGDTILEIYGLEKNILKTERIGLNILQRMSGIATQTKYLKELISNYRTKIAATRKTHWSYLDKKAVYLGGGLTHRLSLSDSILIKDNHLEILKKQGIKNVVEESLERVSNYKDLQRALFVEIEVTKKEDAIKAAKKFKELKFNKPCIIMLDNIIPKDIVKILDELKKRDLYNHILLEASGGINDLNITDYAKTSVDVISLGYLTHSIKSLDMSLDFV